MSKAQASGAGERAGFSAGAVPMHQRATQFTARGRELSASSNAWQLRAAAAVTKRTRRAAARDEAAAMVSGFVQD